VGKYHDNLAMDTMPRMAPVGKSGVDSIVTDSANSAAADADRPTDIVVVYLRSGARLTRNTDPIEVPGMLDVGSATDKRTGFVSMLRVVDASRRRL